MDTLKRNVPGESKHQKDHEQHQNDGYTEALGAAAVRYRSEHSRSLNDREKYQSLELLIEMGALARFDDVQTYHGRVAHVDDGQMWRVDPAFRNGGNDSGNRNVFGGSALYTANEDVAEAFSSARQGDTYVTKAIGGMNNWLYGLSEEERRVHRASYDSVVRKEIHDIATEDKDAVIIRNAFSFSELNDGDKAAYTAAMSKLVASVPLTVGSPLESTISSKPIQPIMEYLIASGQTYFTLDQIDALSAATNADPNEVSSLVTSFNARSYVSQSLRNAAYLIQSDTSSVNFIGDEGTIPVSTEYITRFFRETHIVGWESKVRSATLGKVIDIVALFDLQKVNTTESYELNRNRDSENLLPIAHAFDSMFEQPQKHALSAALYDAHVTPERLIGTAKMIPGFKAIFEADAGNWEGYTLEQHTEAVLRNFDENYADRVPVELLAPLRLAIIAHDLGKPAAVKKDKKMEESYNQAVGATFFSKLGVTSEASTFLRDMTAKGMRLAAPSAIFGDDKRLPELRRYAAMSLERLTDNKPSEAMIDGYLEICEMLVTCDGGAYTRMALTKDIEHQVYRRNHASFDDSFVPPVGMGMRDLKLKHAGIAARSRQVV